MRVCGLWTDGQQQAVLHERWKKEYREKNLELSKNASLFFYLCLLLSVMTGGDNELEWCESVCVWID